MRRFIMSLLAIALIGTGRAIAQQNGRIEGFVRSPDHRPILNARILVVGGTTSTGVNDQGQYSIEAVPAGLVSVRATAPGFKAAEFDGLRVAAGKTVSLDFELTAMESTQGIAVNQFERASITVPMNVQLRFQLLRPITTATTDKSIMPIDSALRDLFQWPGYQLLAQAAIVADLPFPPGHPVNTQQSLNANGETYDLVVQVDSALGRRVRLRVQLFGLVPVAGQPSGGRGGTTTRQTRVLLSTTVTVGFGHTVVLGSTQPAGGRGGMSGTLILAVRPESQVVRGQ